MQQTLKLYVMSVLSAVCVIMCAGCAQFKDSYSPSMDRFREVYNDAVLHEKQGDLDAARQLYLKALDLKPDYPRLGERVRSVEKEFPGPSPCILPACHT